MLGKLPLELIARRQSQFWNSKIWKENNDLRFINKKIRLP